MAEQELDALVVRAPDNVLYLSNFWGMKGYDAVVFPREGDPVLVCLEASEADAERMSWTSDVRFFLGYDEADPRPPGLRALDLVRQIASAYDRVGLELSLGTQAADRMIGEPTTFPKAWFDAFPDAVDATPLLSAVRAIKTEQELERMRLANELAALAMEHVQEHLRPGMTEAQVAAMWEGWVHEHGTGFDGKVELARGFSLVWSGPGIRTFTATGNRPIQEHEPTLFEIWVVADGYWCDHTKNLVVGELDPRYAELEQQLMHVYACATSSVSAGAITGRAGQGDPRDSWPKWAIPASRAIPSATASAPARTSRPMPTRPAVARWRPAWCWRSSRASTGRRAADCGSRTTS